jgi:pimeloyl-ACP methyl ester carboxylesterase
VDRVDVGAVELCYERFGDAGDPTLVLVHGLGSSLATWDERFVHMLLDQGFSVVVFDTRDAGRSTILDDAPPFDMAAALRGDRSVVSYTLDDMADDLSGLLRALELRRAHLVGVSMGAMIAQLTTIRHPDQVMSLCSVMSTTGAPDVGLPSAAAGAVLTRRPAEGRQGFVDQELENQTVIGSARHELVDLEWRRAKYERIYDHGVHPRGSGRQLMAILASGDRTDRLRAVTVPTLVVHGDADPLVDVSGGEATARAVPGAELLIVPGMGHELPPATWPTVVAAIAANARRAERARPGAPRGRR